MSTNWRITPLNGVLLAAYFIPTWAVVAWRIIVSPVQGLYERPSVAVGLFLSDHLQLASMTTVRIAWLLALGRLTVVAFLALFLVLALRGAIRKVAIGKEALAVALGIGSTFSFLSMMMASQVGETEALRLHASELLVMLGTVVLMIIDAPAKKPQVEPAAAQPDLSLEQSELSYNR